MKETMLILPFLLAWGIFGVSAQTIGPGTGYLLLDDFTGEVSKIGTAWEGFTDQVMGGRSEMLVTRVPDRAEPHLRMQGKVSLERNGGFIQVRLMLSASGKPVDASGYNGIRLVVRGEGSGYYIFLRTSQTLFPWKFYKAPVPVTGTWQTMEIPWSSFESGDYGRLAPLKENSLKSIALSAYGEEFNARIDLKEIGLY